MSPETQEFGAIFTEIQNEFSADPVITVTPVAGHPPSQYQVTYNLPSTVKNEQGDIVIDSSHVITISIPFGFPHFSPNCKPKSPIFHPDFDSAAICLGNFWNRERTLPELIRHIGRMLSGELYTTENAFNEEALNWFLEHSQEIPFTSTSQSAIPVSEVLTLEKTEESEELDILEDQDFIDEIDFADEEDLAASDLHQSPPPPVPPSESFDSDHLIRLSQLRNYNQLEDELAAVDPSFKFSEKAELEAKTSTALNEARELYVIAGELEDAGNSQKALEAFREVEALVADFPNIRDDIMRTEQSAVMLGEINGSIDQKNAISDTEESFAFDSLPDSQTFDEPVDEPKKDGKSEKRKPHFFDDDTTKKSVNIVPIFAACAVLCIVVTLTYYYFSLTGKLTEAKQLFSECTSQFAAKDFHASEKSCLSALDTTTNIFLVHQGDKQELQASIRKILNSEELRQGLLGNVLHNGRYVPLSLLEAHQSFFEATTKGNESFDAKTWNEAITHYQNAINIARRTRDIPTTDLLEIEKNLNEAEFYSQLEGARAAVDKEEWTTAIEILTKLEPILETLEANAQPKSRQEIQSLMAKSQFAQLKTKADTLFSQSDWTGAFDMFQQAIEAGQSLSETEPGTLDTLQHNIAKAEIYSTINEGNSAFAAGKWDLAITEYRKAKDILSQKGDLLNIKDIDQSQKKIDRIILQSALLRERQAADKHREAGDQEAALRNLQDMVNHIKYGNFSNDPEFSKTLKEIQDTQANLRDELYIGELQQYLIDNFARLFIQNYPAASSDSLSAPSATFEKRVGSLYLFKMQCTESGRGRPLKLIMYYAYNPVTDTWKFHSQSE
ncbi:hypothetical protein [Desulfopila sp. IMCC35008]|uniref:hypothetical protein n=1 Tax=Desulfopila sp. IMCC35008 TaxID=2653858 RepID=UPI0013D2BE4E|nr:hypothetical protein [Desulfopila sp. IMCC35008]